MKVTKVCPLLSVAAWPEDFCLFAAILLLSCKLTRYFFSFSIFFQFGLVFIQYGAVTIKKVEIHIAA